jgi:hypothetical protein
MVRQAPRKQSRAGAPAGNENARRRVPLRWPGYDLKSREGVDEFLCNLIKQTYSENVLDPRTVGALNNTTRLLLESRGWVQKTPLQILQAQPATSREEVITDFINTLPAELKNPLAEYVKKQAQLESNQ